MRRGKTVDEMESVQEQDGGAAVIRQAISCDICGRDMQQSNHWFVACEKGTELRVSVWTPRGRLHGGAKHLCGQTCLHKLMDEFLAKISAARLAAGGEADETQAEPAKREAPVRVLKTAQRAPMAEVAAVRSMPLPVSADGDEFESSARLLTDDEVSKAVEPVKRLPVAGQRAWHAEAWKRERERAERQGTGRRSIA